MRTLPACMPQAIDLPRDSLRRQALWPQLQATRPRQRDRLRQRRRQQPARGKLVRTAEDLVGRASEP